MAPLREGGDNRLNVLPAQRDSGVWRVALIVVELEMRVDELGAAVGSAITTRPRKFRRDCCSIKNFLSRLLKKSLAMGIAV